MAAPEASVKSEIHMLETFFFIDISKSPNSP
jgi:hypothetical protein